jgi:hypothetical protein
MLSHQILAAGQETFSSSKSDWTYDGISLEHLEDSLLLTVLCSPLASRGQQSLFDCPL